MAECEEWFDHPITRLHSDVYEDIWDVFRRTRWLVGVQGARCTTELKKVVRQQFTQSDDIQVFGFDPSEASRVERFCGNNPEVILETPLIERNISKERCLGILQEVGIELPVMYRLGFNNNNCIGCVKGQQGYWNKIREHFPDVFARMSQVEQELNVAINKSYAGDGKRKRVFLKDLPPGAGRDKPLEPMSCDIFCTEPEVNK